jgi:hypothetical protein
MAARPVRFLLVLLLFALILIVKPGPSSAQAAMGSGTVARAPRVPTSTPENVTYHGGSVMTGTMNVYAIFWEPQGWAVDPNYNGLIIQYYNDVGGSSLYKLMEQYTDADGGIPTGAVLAGTWVDPHDYPGSGNPRPAPTPQQTLTEVQTAMQINGWQAGPPTTSWSIPRKASSLTTTVATIVVTRIRSFLGISALPILDKSRYGSEPVMILV